MKNQKTIQVKGDKGDEGDIVNILDQLDNQLNDQLDNQMNYSQFIKEVNEIKIDNNNQLFADENYQYPGEKTVLGDNFQLIFDIRNDEKNKQMTTAIIANREDKFKNYGFITIKNYGEDQTSFTFLAKFKSLDLNQEKDIKQSNQSNQLNQSLNQSNIFNSSQIKGNNNNYQYPELDKTPKLDRTNYTNNQNQQNQLDVNNRNQYPLNFNNNQSSNISLGISNSSYISSKSASFFILNQHQQSKKTVGNGMIIEEIIGVIDNQQDDGLIKDIAKDFQKKTNIIKKLNTNSYINLNIIKNEVSKIMVDYAKHNEKFSPLLPLISLNQYKAKNDEFILQLQGNNLLLQSPHYPHRSNINDNQNYAIGFNVKNGNLVDGVFRLHPDQEKKLKDKLNIDNHLITVKNGKISQIIYKFSHNPDSKDFIKITSDDCHKFMNFLDNIQYKIDRTENNQIIIGEKNPNCCLPKSDEKKIKIEYIKTNPFINSNLNKKEDIDIATLFLWKDPQLLIRHISPILNNISHNNQETSNNAITNLNQYSTALNIIKQDHPSLYQNLQQKSNNQADIIIKKFQQSFDLQKNKITSQELEKLQQESNFNIKQLTNIDKIFGIKSLDNFKQSESYNNLKTESLQQASNLNNKAEDLYYNKEKYQESLELHLKALNIREIYAPNSLDFARSLNGVGFCQSQLNKPQEALNLHLKALNIQQEKAPNSLDEARSYHGIGNAYYGLKEYKQAINYYEKAIKIKADQAPNSLDLANSYHNIGIAYDDLKEYKQAINYYEKAIKIKADQAPNSLDLANSYHNIGIAYDDLKEYKQAINYYEKAIKIRADKAPNSLDLAYSYNNIGIAYENKGDKKSAEEFRAKSNAIKASLEKAQNNIKPNNYKQLQDNQNQH